MSKKTPKEPPSKKTVLIIGAGIAGLSAGSFLQMTGYQTEIFESHDKAGGPCAFWHRKGYTIDGCSKDALSMIAFENGTVITSTPQKKRNSISP